MWFINKCGRVCSSVAEREIADLRVAGSIPVAPLLAIDRRNGKIRVSLVGQDTWFSPRRPGFESRTRNNAPTMRQQCATIVKATLS
jgi:hypothetical protein